MIDDGTRTTGQEKGLVSVVIPFARPTEDYLRQAVESIAAQTYDHWEVVLADDGDSLEDRAMAQSIVEPLGDRGRVVTHASPGNRGISAARNTGIRNARGEFIAFLDADDVYLPHKLEFAVSTLQDNPGIGLVCSNTRYWYSWNPANEKEDFVPDLGTEGRFEPPELLCAWLEGSRAVPAPCSFTARRDAIDHVNGFEERFPGLYEDQVFLAKAALSQRVMVIDNVTALYRQHSMSICAGGTRDESSVARRKFLHWLKTYNSHTAYPQVDATIEGELWKLDHPRIAKVRRLISKAIGRALPERVT